MQKAFEGAREDENWSFEEPNDVIDEDCVEIYAIISSKLSFSKCSPISFPKFFTFCNAKVETYIKGMQTLQ